MRFANKTIIVTAAEGANLGLCDLDLAKFKAATGQPNFSRLRET